MYVCMYVCMYLTIYLYLSIYLSIYLYIKANSSARRVAFVGRPSVLFSTPSCREGQRQGGTASTSATAAGSAPRPDSRVNNRDSVNMDSVDRDSVDRDSVFRDSVKFSTPS